MVNGPPTPPPTTAAEIQDEARTIENPIPLDTTEKTPPVTEDPYRAAFAKIADLASGPDLTGLVHFAENVDVNSDANSEQSRTRLLVTGPLILAYLIIDELLPARFALTRLPENVSATPFGKALAQLLASAWERNHAKVYTRAEKLVNLIHQDNFFDSRLEPVVSLLVARFMESFRRRTFSVLSTAYTSLPASLAQIYLGMGKDELIAVTQNLHWSHELSSDIISPRVDDSANSHAQNYNFSSLSAFHLVANSVAKLEV